MSTLVLRRQPGLPPLNLAPLRRLARALLREELGRTSYALEVTLVDAPTIAALNERFLRHPGPTDVITFDYGHRPPATGRAPRPRPRHGRQSVPTAAGPLAGEVLICVEVAVAQGRRFRTGGAAEVLRYLVHGVLHLSGYDDRRAADRRAMKREEDRLTRALARQPAYPVWVGAWPRERTAPANRPPRSDRTVGCDCGRSSPSPRPARSGPSRTRGTPR